MNARKTAAAKVYATLTDTLKTVDEIKADLSDPVAALDEILHQLVELGLVEPGKKLERCAYKVVMVQRDIEQLRAENCYLKQNLFKLLFKEDEDVPTDFDSLMELCQNEPTLEQLLEELNVGHSDAVFTMDLTYRDR